MLPAVAAALFGATLVGRFDLKVAALHAVTVALAVYTAHLKDGLVDFHGRREDDDHPLTRRGCRLCLGGSTLGFAAGLGVLWAAASPLAALITAPTWVLAYFHAPQLDTNPVTATAGYPLGIGLAIVGGTVAQTGSVPPLSVAFGGVFLVLLSGVKVVDDSKDVEFDRSIAKRTVAVVLGPARARGLAYGLMTAALLGVVGLAAAGVFPAGTAAAPVPFAAVALVAVRADDDLATMLLIRGAYVFLAVLVGAVWFRPLG